MPTLPSSRKKPLKGRDTRFFARISSSDKSLIEQAAVIAGQSTATFVITQAREAASRLFEQQLLRLTREESRRVVEALLSPAKSPNEAFKKALQDYRHTVISDVNPKSPTRPAKRASGKKASPR